MKKMNHKRQRRGLSSVVGAVFMVLVMIGALNVILLALNQQSNVTQAVIDQTSKKLNSLNEKISIPSITVVNNKFNITATNDGGTTAHLVSLYVVNETASPKTEYRYNIDYTVTGRSKATNIGQTLVPTLVAKDNIDYTIKVVTEAGNTAIGKVSKLSSLFLGLSLIAIPPTIAPGANVTMLLSVTNNSTSYLASPVSANMSYTCSSTCTVVKKATQGNNTSLNPGQTIFFKWVYNIIGSDNTSVSFTSKLVNGKAGNIATERVQIKLLSSSNSTFSYLTVISQDILQKPEIFLIIPSPFGDSPDKGLWGVVVVNPTNSSMDVNRVVISMYSSQAAANQQFIETGAGCALNQVNPTSNWGCPLDNMLEWKNVASPVVVPGYGIKTFLIEAKPGKLTSGPAPAFMISVGVFTSFGQFTKTGLSSSMSSPEPFSLGSVYLTDTTTPSLATDDVHIFGHQLSIVQNANVTLRIAAVDFDTDTGTTIKNGTKLIITVPMGFTNVAIDAAGSTGFYTSGAGLKIVPYSDGSTQIVATMNGALGDTAREAKILSFTAKAPVVSGTKVYILHIHADGETNTNWSISPIGQIGLQVY